MNKIFGKIKGESGQAMVIVALSAVVLFGATALSVDLGMAYNAKAELQAAADAAALAGAQDLPDVALAIATAESYARTNEDKISKVTVLTPYAANSKKIKVTCEREFKYLFAKVLGFDSKTIVASAVAIEEADWVGDALPFINLDEHYDGITNRTLSTGEQYNIQLWERTEIVGSSGDYEKLWPQQSNVDAEYVLTKQADGSYTCKLVDMKDGFGLSKGVNESDLPELKAYLTPLIGETVYVLSLADNLIGVETDFSAKSPPVLTSKIVLLECTLVWFNFDNLRSKDNETFGVFLRYDGADPIPFAGVADGTTIIPDINGFGETYVKLVE